MRKIITYGIILLFVGLAVSPSFSADLSKSKELVEVLVDICGFDGAETHRLKLSREQADRIGSLFDELKYKLDRAGSHEETVAVYEWAFEELDTHLMIKDNSVFDTLRILCKYLGKTEFIDDSNPYSSSETDENMYCLLSGKTTETYFIGKTSRMFLKFRDILIIRDYESKAYPGLVLLLFSILIPVFLILISTFLPFLRFFKTSITYGNSGIGMSGNSKTSKGWVKTLGLYGYKSFEGYLKGKLTHINWDLYKHYTGVVGFRGIHFFDVDTEYHSYIGFANRVKLCYW